MQNILETTPEENTEAVVVSHPGRRTFLTRVATTGLGLAVLRFAQPALASPKPKQPEAETGHDYPMPMSHAKTEADFRNGVIGPATLSHLASQMAVDKASDPATFEFANFELREAIGVLTVLKEMKTPVPPLDATARTILAKLKSAPKGDAFDKIYIKAQLANHEFLRDHATTYLKNSMGRTSMAEMHGRHLAMLTLGTFKEHVVHCKNILKTL